jgi:hypothetical protein
MSYYILPKNKNVINVCPIDSTAETCQPYISHSLLNYYNDIIDHIKYLCHDSSRNYFDEITKIVNPYEYIFSKVPGSHFAVSKLKPKTNLFYEFLEIITTLNLFDCYNKDTIKSLHITPNHADSIDCVEMIREKFSDEIECYDGLDDEIFRNISYNKYDFIFFEPENVALDSQMYSLIECVMIILRNQIYGGGCVIKIGCSFHKPIIDVMYFLSTLYDKVYIIKPSASNITTFCKYIVCKNFQINSEKMNYLKLNYYRLLVFLKKLSNKNIISLFNFEIPHYFTAKLEDMNMIMGQQQLDSLNLIVNILRNKNREEKIELIKKTNIQKAVIWCEKHRIPCNKFSEKINIFLPIIKDPNHTDKEKKICHGFESQEFASIIEEYSSRDFTIQGFVDEKF